MTKREFEIYKAWCNRRDRIDKKYINKKASGADRRQIAEILDKKMGHIKQTYEKRPYRDTAKTFEDLFYNIDLFKEYVLWRIFYEKGIPSEEKLKDYKLSLEEYVDSIFTPNICFCMEHSFKDIMSDERNPLCDAFLKKHMDYHDYDRYCDSGFIIDDRRYTLRIYNLKTEQWRKNDKDPDKEFHWCQEALDYMEENPLSDPDDRYYILVTEFDFGRHYGDVPHEPMDMSRMVPDHEPWMRDYYLL